MPLIFLGVIILVVAFLVFPLLILLFSNPLILGVGLIVLGLLWVVVPKLFYGIIYCIAKPYYYWNENIIPKLETKIWWQSTIRTKNKFTNIIDSDWFGRVFICGLIFLGVVLVIYFEYNPLV